MSVQPPKKAHVVIVGAGIVGVATALHLFELGIDVTLIDMHEDVALGASKNNGAQLSYSYTDALAAPGLFSLASRIVTGREKGIKIGVRPSLYNYSWIAMFAFQSRRKRFLENTLANLKLAMQSQSQMARWITKYGFAFRHEVNGKLHLLPNQASIKSAKEMIATKQAEGAEQFLLSFDEVLQQEPRLKSFNAPFVGAVYSPAEEVGDPNLFARAAVEYISAQSGRNVLLSSTHVQDVVVEQGAIKKLVTNGGTIKADSFVFATGKNIKRFARLLGLMQPVMSIAGYSLTYPLGPNAPKHSITDVKSKVVLCPLGDELRIAGFADIGLANDNPPPDRLEQLKQVLATRFPGAADMQGDGAPWVGHRPATPNSQPIIGKTKLANAFVNAGHGALGWTLAAGSAQRVANDICNYLQVANKQIQEITTDYKEQVKADHSAAKLAKSA